MASLPKIPKHYNPLSGMLMIFAVMSFVAGAVIIKAATGEPGQFDGYQLWIFPVVGVIHTVLAVFLQVKFERTRRKILSRP